MLLVVFALGPIVWLIQNSIKPRIEIFRYPIAFFFRPSFATWTRLLRNQTVWRNLRNSVIIAFSSSCGLLVIAGASGYALSRYTFRGRQGLVLGLMATRLLPPISSVVVLYLLYNRLGLIDSRFGLILIYTALHVPVATWLLKVFFDTVPVELEESALIDGCSRLQAVVRITTPLAAPGIATVGLLFFVRSWNEFMFAFIFTNVRSRTVPLIIAETIGEFEIYWDQLAAQSTLVMLPALLVALFAQKYIVRGLTAGALK
jgi:multiple sugar transport system permease protein